ncbi:zinc finger translocation-associated protein [Ambystoma mexicanum]|uniref:zinc finger translocation-associated protein n=1 Tax=Ambystoma mexicanum TaxID=8296 RepID=UPI0037E78F4C
MQMDGTTSSSVESESPGEVLLPDQCRSPSGDLSWSSLDSNEAFPLPVGRRLWDHCEERASRPGNSRIPGRDHRRYYHNHWRLEYLMDFDARCHSMICMVCGSSLATLKLSTIKRHIHQKHPYSINWNVKEKEAIITSWDAHLCLEAKSPGTECEGVPTGIPHSPEDVLQEPLLGSRKRRRRLPPVTKSFRQSTGRGGKRSQDTVDLEQYLNESLQNWFRMEFMMDYNSEKNKLFCMMCGSMLSNLNLQDIKQHILDSHPKSLDFSEEEKNIILGAWKTKAVLEEEVKKVQEVEQVESKAVVKEDEQQVVKDEKPDEDVQEIMSTATVYNVEKQSVIPVSAPTSIPAPIALSSLAPVVVSAPFAILCPVRIPASGQTPINFASLAPAPLTTHPSIPAPVKVKASSPTAVQPTDHVDLTMDESEEERLADSPPCDSKESSPSDPPKLQPNQNDVAWVDDPDTNMTDLMPSKGRGRDHKRYYQDRWRMEYLMDYNCVTHGLVCMVCGSSLTTLKVSTIKRHIHQKHEETIFLSDTEKLVILEEWDRKMSHLVGPGCSSPDHSDVKNVVITENGVDVEEQAPTPQDFSTQGNADTSSKTLLPKALPSSNYNGLLSVTNIDHSTSEDRIQASSWDFCFGKTRGRGRDQRSHYQDRWRLEYMMDYNRTKNGLVCMVCSCAIPTLKLSTIKMHIQQKHPDTTYLSDQEKAVIIEEWNQKTVENDAGSVTNPGATLGMDNEICVEISDDSVQQLPPHESITKKNSTKKPKIFQDTCSEVETSEASACSTNPFKNQRRNYQVRWRTEYMMDYDCRRHGLICMVCGGTLATLKVSTIKRHIVQVHPYSVDFSPEEQQRILEAYSEMALHYIHSEECFKQSQHEPGRSHHSHPACGSTSQSSPCLTAASDDVIVI